MDKEQFIYLESYKTNINRNDISRFEIVKFKDLKVGRKERKRLASLKLCDNAEIAILTMKPLTGNANFALGPQWSLMYGKKYFEPITKELLSKLK